MTAESGDSGYSLRISRTIIIWRFCKVNKKYIIKKEKKKIERAENFDELADTVFTNEERRELAKELYRKDNFKLAELEEGLSWEKEQIYLLKEIVNARKTK